MTERLVTDGVAAAFAPPELISTWHGMDNAERVFGLEIGTAGAPAAAPSGPQSA